MIPVTSTFGVCAQAVELSTTSIRAPSRVFLIIPTFSFIILQALTT